MQRGGLGSTWVGVGYSTHVAHGLGVGYGTHVGHGVRGGDGTMQQQGKRT